MVEIFHPVAKQALRNTSKKLGYSLKDLMQIGYCELVCLEMADLLRPIQSTVLGAGVMQRNVKLDDGRPVNYHRHLALGDLRVDPTWKFFVANPNPCLPDVLITKEDELIKTLTEFGIAERFHFFWTDTFEL